MGGLAGVAVQLLNGTGTRVYTNRFGAQFTTGLTLSAGASGAQLLYLNNSVPVDTTGITYATSTPVQLPGVGPLQPVSSITLVSSLQGVAEKGESRVDPLGQAYLSTVPGFVNATIGASNLNSLAPNYAACTAPISFTNGLRPPTQPSASNGATRVSYSYALSDGVSYRVVANLTLSLSSAFATSTDLLGNPYQTVTNITGTRTYTYLGNGQTVTSQVTGLSTALSSLTSQRFYPYTLLASSPGVYTANTAPFFDGDGIEFSVTPSVPIDGNAPGSGTQHSAVQLFFSSPVGGSSNAVLTEGASNATPVQTFQQQVYSLLV